MLVTVGQPLRKARTTTTGPCRAPYRVRADIRVDHGKVHARRKHGATPGHVAVRRPTVGHRSPVPPVSGSKSTSSPSPRTLAAAQDPAANSACTRPVHVFSGHGGGALHLPAQAIERQVINALVDGAVQLPLALGALGWIG